MSGDFNRAFFDCLSISAAFSRPLLLPLGGLVEVFEKGGRKVSYNLYKEGVFAAEMVRYLAERNAGVFGYVAHRNLHVPLFAYQLFGGAQYFLAGAGRLFFARFVHWGFNLYVRAKIECPPPFLCQTNSENFRVKKHYLANRIVASFSGAPESCARKKIRFPSKSESGFPPPEARLLRLSQILKFPSAGAQDFAGRGRYPARDRRQSRLSSARLPPPCFEGEDISIFRAEPGLTSLPASISASVIFAIRISCFLYPPRAWS